MPPRRFWHAAGEHVSGPSPVDQGGQRAPLRESGREPPLADRPRRAARVRTWARSTTAGRAPGATTPVRDPTATTRIALLVGDPVSSEQKLEAKLHKPWLIDL